MNLHAERHLQTSAQLIAAYDGKEPLASYLKKYFSMHKKHGSKDRKAIVANCYAHFRTLASKFPLGEHISDQINQEALIQSYSLQPLLFLRIRPGKKTNVLQSLQSAAIVFKQIGDDVLALQNTISIDKVLQINKEVVIQDLNSQAFKKILSSIRDQVKSVWDVCAASGGKSILMYDVLDKPYLTLTDIRASIIHNAQKRLSEAKVPVVQFAVQDMSKPVTFSKTFDLVFADVPCSGSGTWGRTPEQLAFFTTSYLSYYTSLQQQIVANCVKAVKPGGYFIYATCSIYKDENELQVQSILKEHSFELISEQYFVGYDQQADTLYGALLKKK
jgi:16S rRNA (cytosine967-C5)-methyltransferase